MNVDKHEGRRNPDDYFPDIPLKLVRPNRRKLIVISGKISVIGLGQAAFGKRFFPSSAVDRLVTRDTFQVMMTLES
jgi:hypothetical protein